MPVPLAQPQNPKSVERASRPPPLVAQAFSLGTAPAGRVEGALSTVDMHRRDACATTFLVPKLLLGNPLVWPSSCLAKIFPSYQHVIIHNRRSPSRAWGTICVPKQELGNEPFMGLRPTQDHETGGTGFPVPGHPRAGVLHFQSSPNLAFCTQLYRWCVRRTLRNLEP